MNLIKTLPIPITGLILALLSLGNLLNDINPNLKLLFGGLGCIFLILIILKIIFYFDNLTHFMPSIAYALWIIGIALHILLMIYFTYHFIIHDFNISDVYPSYWIVFVGITMAAITSHSHGLEGIGYIFFIMGFIAMVLTLPLVVYRYVKYSNIPDMNKPLICIFTAVLSILIVGYLNSTQNPSNEFVIILYVFACMLYIFALYKFIDYRNLDFYPSFAAFTFPFVISALATKGVMGCVGGNSILGNALIIETVIATLIVCYILIRYLKFLKNSNKSRN